MTNKTLYSKTTGGFYRTEINISIPEDAVEITEAHYHALFEGQAGGKRIVADQYGYPVLQDPPPLSREHRIARINVAVQNKLDSTAAMYNFDSIRDAISYADEPTVPLYQRQGLAFRSWRSVVWKYVEDLIASSADADNLPTPQDVVNTLPPLNVG